MTTPHKDRWYFTGTLSNLVSSVESLQKINDPRARVVQGKLLSVVEAMAKELYNSQLTDISGKPRAADPLDDEIPF